MKRYELESERNLRFEKVDYNNNVTLMEKSWRVSNFRLSNRGGSNGKKNSLTSDRNPDTFQNYLNDVGRNKRSEIIRDLETLIGDLQNGTKLFFRECSRVESEIRARAEKHFPVMEIDFARSQLLYKLHRAGLARISILKKQMMTCRNLLNMVNRWESFDSFSDLGKKVKEVLNYLEEMEATEDCHISFVPSDDLRLGGLVLSASARYSTVEASGYAVADVVSTCHVSVRDILGEPVKSDFRLDATVIDGDDNPVYLSIKNLNNSRFEIEFLPLSEGKHVLYANLNGVPISGTPKVINVKEPDTSLDVVFGQNGVGDGEFARPWGVACDAAGRIIVSDRCNHRIQIFSGDGKFLKKFGKEGSAPGELNRPAGLATDKFHRIIVSDKDNHRIQIFDCDGGYITHFGNFGSVENNLYYPWDVAVTDDCQIAVTETKRKRVRVFTDTGIELMRFDFTQDKGLDLPRGITALSEGPFLVTDFNKHKIVLLSEDLTRVSYLGIEGAKPQEFFRPQSVAHQGNLLAVSDCKNHRIQVFKNNKIWKIIGAHGSDKEKMIAPQGIAFHPDGRLIVVDYGNNRVQIFNM